MYFAASCVVISSPEPFYLTPPTIIILQVLAMETRKGVPYFKVKWVDIAPAGSTWEPAAHFIGDPAKTALSVFRQKRASDQAATEVARAQVRAGNKSGTRHASGGDNVGSDRDVDVVSDDTNCAMTKQQFRKKQSDVWKFFAHKRFEVAANAYLAKCKICGIDIKALNTTNLKAHLNSIHAEQMCKYKTDNNKASCPGDPQLSMSFISVTPF